MKRSGYQGFPLGGGIQPGGRSSAGGGIAGGSVVALASYPGGGAALVNSAVQTLFCPSGSISNEALGVIIRARGLIKYSNTGTPALTLRLCQTTAVSLATVVVGNMASGVANKIITFDLNAIFDVSAQQTTQFGSFAIDNGTVPNSVYSSITVNQIFGASPISPLSVSMQWSAADPANTALIVAMLWEIYYPAVL